MRSRFHQLKKVVCEISANWSLRYLAQVQSYDEGTDIAGWHLFVLQKVRQSWNKFNLYNLSRYKGRADLGTFFQQKWKAKSISRAYHGEQIREGQWTRMFTPRAKAVIPMDHKYLAEYDGSELAAGRGSGLDRPMGKRRNFDRNQIPYMSMVYAPMERRLDTAIFRALFASSTRQARQFVVHGKVKVNGKKVWDKWMLLQLGSAIYSRNIRCHTQDTFWTREICFR